MVRDPGPPPIRRPGAATAAAVLALVESGLGLLVACLLVLAHPRPVTVAVLVVLVLLATGALLSVGAVHVLRGSGWRLLVAVTTVQVVLVLGLVGGAVTVVPGSSRITGLVLGALLLAPPTTRLVLAVRPSVGRWVARSTPRRRPAPSWGVLAPFAVVVLLLVAVLADPPAPAPDPADLLAPTGADRYDGGRPVPPPLSAAADYDPAFDGLAQDCYAGDMVACDDMFVQAPEGSAYAYLGDTCGGREHESVDGACRYLPPD